MTELKICVPEFCSQSGFKFNWTKGFEIKSTIEQNTIKIVANKEGLLSLANHLLNLAQDTVPVGFHLNFDEINSLEDESIEIIIEKVV